MNQAEAAANLVIRSRQGDQNAVAMIAMVRENANRGVKKAQDTYRLIESYVKSHPYTEMGSEEIQSKQNEDSLKHCVQLANFGVSLTKKNIKKMANTFAGHRDAFMFGVENFRDLKGISQKQSEHPHHANAIVYGRNVGLARNIQLAKDPQIPLRHSFPNIAWELGE